MKPIIAVTTYGRYEKDLSNPWYKEHFSIPAQYIDAIRRAGGVPLLMPPGEGEITAVLAIADGVLIIGGSAIHPDQYQGNSQHPNLTVHDLERDKTELTLVSHLINGDKLPTLAICRGVQILNVALGGTLHEHVADLSETDIHRNEAGEWTLQPVNVTPSSLLAEVMQATEVVTTSGHHQGLKDVAPGLTVSATAPDGIIEAVEHTGLPWMLGVQWHPEVTAAADPTQQRLFDELVQEAAQFKARRTE